jgi:hypothetical protein
MQKVFSRHESGRIAAFLRTFSEGRSKLTKESPGVLPIDLARAIGARQERVLPSVYFGSTARPQSLSPQIAVPPPPMRNLPP